MVESISSIHWRAHARFVKKMRYVSHRTKVIAKRLGHLSDTEIIKQLKYPSTDPQLRDLALAILGFRSMIQMDYYLEKQIDTGVWPERFKKWMKIILEERDLDTRWLIAHGVMNTPYHDREAKKLEKWLRGKSRRDALSLANAKDALLPFEEFGYQLTAPESLDVLDMRGTDPINKLG